MTAVFPLQICYGAISEARSEATRSTNVEGCARHRRRRDLEYQRT
jgi:hypothetical protein